MSSGVTSSVLTAVPAVAGTVATATGGVPDQWTSALIVLIGVSVLVTIAAHFVNIWKATRKEPPVETQIQNAIDRHEKAAKERAEDQQKSLDANFEQVGKDIERVEKRIEGHDDQLRELWRAVPYTARQPG